MAHAKARDAVLNDLNCTFFASYNPLIVHSYAQNRAIYLRRPDLGRRLANPEKIQRGDYDAVLIIADGLSATAVHRHAGPVLDGLLPLLEGWKLAPIFLVEQGRVAISDEIGELLGAKMSVILIGERPGLSSPDSLGAYLTWSPRVGRTDAERNCVSNIREEGLKPSLAARRIAMLMEAARGQRVSGVRLGGTAILAADESGTGILHLKRFWTQNIASRTGGNGHPSSPDDLRADKVLLAGLRLGLRETLDFLMTETRSFEEFEAWVLTKNGGAIEPARVTRLNGALRGDGTFVLESILPEPVLSAADLAFWDEHGYVVLKQAVSDDSCRAAVEAILNYAGMSMEQPDSWYKKGLWIPLAHHPALWENRNSRRIHTAFAQIWGQRDLWVGVDVCGVNPPLRPGYSFRGTPLHWDMTLEPPLRFGTQAILYLTDTAADQGAFSCVPGFHRQLEAWLKGIPAGSDPRTIAATDLHATPIAGRAGDLIIWHQALPHGATPNLCTSPRIAQYINMFPSQHDVNTVWR
jgi:hypothetical protein